jgi:hypothetical protein
MSDHVSGHHSSLTGRWGRQGNYRHPELASLFPIRGRGRGCSWDIASLRVPDSLGIPKVSAHATAPFPAFLMLSWARDDGKFLSARRDQHVCQALSALITTTGTRDRIALIGLRRTR